jgi:glycerate dehydrogenase
MNITVLDGYTLNPGDLSWDQLKELGSVTVYDRTNPNEFIERARTANILLTNKTLLTEELIKQLPELLYIGVLATGYNVVSLQAAKARGIPVTNFPAYSTYSVAQHVFALLLQLCNQVERHNQAVHEGEWSGSTDFSFTKSPLIELHGKVMGLVGLGRIGEQTARIANAYGMRVLAVGSGKSAPSPVDGVEWTDLHTLLSHSDVISLHCPLTHATESLIDASRIRLMKPSAFLINTSRGPIVHEHDLADALHRGQLAGAALDVLSTEPPHPDNPLLAAPNCILTPHIAWATKEARARLMDIAVNNVRSFLEGKPVNVVS